MLIRLRLICAACLFLLICGCGQSVDQTEKPAEPKAAPAIQASVTPTGAKTGSLEQSEEEVTVVNLAQGLDHPWGMAYLPDDEGVLITEKYGGVMRYRDGRLTRLTGAPEAFEYGESGLLDIALSPDFATDRRVYISFVQGGRASNRNALFTATLQDDALVDGAVIYTGTERRNSTRHSASRLLFLPDKTLLMSMGDGAAEAAQAQNLSSTLGKIIQLDTAGKPVSTPYFEKSVAGLFSMGHRNIEGLAIDPQSGAIWSTEHGPMGGDELNLIEAGKNYGWPVTTFGLNADGTIISRKQSAKGVTDPYAIWVPSIAPSGLAVYRGSKYPDWDGDLFAGALSGMQLRRMRVRNGEVVLQEVLLRQVQTRIRDVMVSPEGDIYLLTDGENGKLRKLIRE